ncbi:hypothetical protein CTI12_AA485840 [Artemisia annua]|uniref:Uncharacterized protein n=1 Tax=Artemisia annua TaxID=35608 RepID=A0A2U1LJ70_ARTAN|nr:hypothetical protein CTI12_AA485840 [Artemisia annua]
MASVSSKMKMLGTAAGRATRNKWFNWPLKESVKETDAGVYNEEHNLARVDWDRIILFPGKWYLPPVTVKPKFEFWKYECLKSEREVLTEPKVSSIFRARNLFYVGAGVLVIAGIVYYVRRQQRKRFEAKVADAAAESVRGALDQAFQSAAAQAFPGAITQALQNSSVQDAFLQALQSPAVHDAIGQALQNAAEGAAVQALQNAAGGAAVEDAFGHGLQNDAAQVNVDIHGALIRALQDDVVKDAIGLAARDAIAPVHTSNLTTKEVLKAQLDGNGVKEMDLGTLQNALGLQLHLPKLQDRELKLEDIVTSSVKELVGYGIPKASFILLRYFVLRPCSEDEECSLVFAGSA